MSPSSTFRKRIRDDRLQGGVIAFFFSVGVVGHVLLPEWMAILTPAVLWFYGLLAVFIAAGGVQIEGSGTREKIARRRFLAWVGVTYIITFTLEAIGTATGVIFGPYTYGGVLGVMFFSVPLVIGFNWVLVVLGAMRMVQRLPGWIAVPVAALITTAFDFLLEPVAIHLGYWTWHWDGIPIRNYMAWFLTSLLAALAFRLLRIRIHSRLPAYYLVIQTLFFLAIRGLSAI
jgi:putative membrane protein